MGGCVFLYLRARFLLSVRGASATHYKLSRGSWRRKCIDSEIRNVQYETVRVHCWDSNWLKNSSIDNQYSSSISKQGQATATQTSFITECKQKGRTENTQANQVVHTPSKHQRKSNHPIRRNLYKNERVSATPRLQCTRPSPRPIQRSILTIAQLLSFDLNGNRSCTRPRTLLSRQFSTS